MFNSILNSYSQNKLAKNLFKTNEICQSCRNAENKSVSELFAIYWDELRPDSLPYLQGCTIFIIQLNNVYNLDSYPSG